jgi:hypothetical protein
VYHKLVFVLGIGVLGLVLGSPAVASAGVLQFCPSGNCAASNGENNDLDDLDHHNFYVWKLGGVSLGAGNTVKNATLTFKQMYNWDANANRLFLQLFDTAKTSGGTQLQSGTGTYANGTYTTAVRYLLDETADQGPMSDVFNNSPYTGSSSLPADCNTAPSSQRKDCAEQKLENTLISGSTAETFLTSRAFAALGGTPASSPGEPLGPGWTVTPDGTSGGNQLYTYTYTFTEEQENALQAYIANSGNVAIGLDPDCHFFNNGVMLTLTTGPTIPEPATLGLLGTALLAAVGYRRRFRAT